MQNLLYDTSQIAIPFDSVDEELVKKPLKWNPDGIGRFMLFFGPLSSTKFVFAHHNRSKEYFCCSHRLASIAALFCAAT